MSYHITDLNRTIRRFRESWLLASNPKPNGQARDTAKADQTENGDRVLGGSLAAE